MYDLAAEHYDYIYDDYPDYDPSWINDQDYQDWNATEPAFHAILQALRDPFDRSQSRFVESFIPILEANLFKFLVAQQLFRPSCF